MNTDVVIIGGSLAGAACVRELSARGVDAIALDRGHFPRPKVCGGFLSPGAIGCLEKLGLEQDVRAAGAVEIDHLQLTAGKSTFEEALPGKGLAISRDTLDALLARSARITEGVHVRNVIPLPAGFRVETSQGEIRARVVIDAAGKLSRFSARKPSNEFGVQYSEERSLGTALRFWFFANGYGGGVTVENSRANFCFLVRKAAVRQYANRPGALVTGPIAYAPLPGAFIAIGDAAGMIDPFCGEGMHHALDSARTAALVVTQCLSEGKDYNEMQRRYRVEWSRRWARKRAMLYWMRKGLRYPQAVRTGFALTRRWLLKELWATIPT